MHTTTHDRPATAPRNARRTARAALRALALVALSTLAPVAALGQSDPLRPPPNRPGRDPLSADAIVGATVHVSPTRVIDNGTVVIRDGRIAAVLQGQAPPPGVRVHQGKGLHVYPGFIDPFVEVDAPRPADGSPGVHWNPRVTPQRSVLDGPGLDQAAMRALRAQGFTVAALAPRGGIFRGSGAVVALNDTPPELALPRPDVIKPDAFQVLSLELGGGFGGGGGGGGGAGGGGGPTDRWAGYPGSKMGAIALVRQTFYDADSRAAQAQLRTQNQAEADPSALDALARGAPGGSLIAFSVEDELELLRGIKIGREFNRPMVFVGSGTEFRRLDAIVADRPQLIVPLSFPEKPQAGSIGELEAIELRTLMTWEQAPTNPARLEKAGLSPLLTSSRLRDRGQFLTNLRSAVRHGLPEQAALEMLTTRPAALLGLAGELGSIDPGKRANLVVLDRPLFDRQSRVLGVWVDGNAYDLAPAPGPLEGTWKLTVVGTVGAGERSLVIGRDNAVTLVEGDTRSRATNVSVSAGRLSMVMDAKPLVRAGEGSAALTGVIGLDQAGKSQTLTGQLRTTDGKSYQWSAARVSDKADLPAPQRTPGGQAPEGEAAPAADDPVGGSWSVRVTGPAPFPPGGLDITMALAHNQGTVTGTIETPFGPSNIDQGTFNAGTGQAVLTATIGPEGNAQQATINLKFAGESFTGTSTNDAGVFQLSGARRSVAGTPRAADEPEAAPNVPERLPGYPFGAFALAELPPQELVIITGGTVWTLGPAGTIENGAVVIRDGKIAFVGSASSIPTINGTARVIDATGKHVTPGIIDAHSHTGISGGVNEGGQTITSEVRIQDVTNPDSVSWYRQLAGGVTAVNSLHGSANPIGGQSQTVKNRWGARHPDDLHVAGAIAGIKFALGENVVQANFPGAGGTRYPQSRMGVEALIRDRFLAAKEYAAARARGEAVRRDLELEALVEIMEGTRLVHAHSYRADEILMLARLSAEFGFKLGTYQHILEGYKVADAVRESSIGASGFSDWWAYKVEVQDAIPAGGPIMAEQGVVVSFNSDSDELARRLYIEAGKARKYSRLPDGTHTLTPEDALKFVTLNPAKQLGIADRVGSIEVGKEADIAVWSASPLSTMTRCERTYVDGRELFSIEKDAELRAQNAEHRARITQKLLRDAPATAGRGTAPAGPRRRPASLLAQMQDDAQRAIDDHYLDMIRRGIDPAAHRTGVCGCEF